ncbi:MAG: hypothetical protein HQ478_03995 [Chloroflexi bacterium]|nr:hypothetical protein [Chloroflexota bacterium]
MGTTFFKRERIAVFVVMGLVALAIACGGDSEALSAPQATAAPAPTAKPAPTVAPTATQEPAEPEVIVTPLEGLDIRPFPMAIGDDAEKLSGDEVEEIWTEYLKGARFGTSESTVTAVYYCADGTGRVLNDPGNVYASGPEGMFDWRVESRPGSRWNDVAFVITPTDPSFRNVFSPDGTYSWSLQVDGDQPTASGSFPLGDARVTQQCG